MFVVPDIDAHTAGHTTPGPAKARPWHTRRSWQRYARDLLRYYSRSSRYRLHLRTEGKGPLAAVSHELHRVVMQTQFPAPAGCLPIRHDYALDAAPTRLWVEGLLSHEAGHIRYSGEKPPHLLGELWNSLEDERMERLMAAAHPDLVADYDTMGDVMLGRYEKKRRDGKTYTDLAAQVLDGALLWRWSHDHGQAPPLPLDTDDFDEVRPLVEAAWEADGSDEVTALALEILSHFDLDPDAPAPKGTLARPDLPVGPINPGGLAGGGDEEDAGGEPADAPDEAPEVPDVDPQSKSAHQAENLLNGLYGAARRLARALKPEAPRRLAVPHRSRGRFDYRRHVSGRGRVFTRRPDAPAPPAYVTVVLDASGSMLDKTARSTRWRVACRAAALITKAAEIAGTDATVLPFRHRPYPALRTDAIGHERVRLHLAEITPDSHDKTELAPALRAAVAAQTRGSAHGREILIVISDGHLTPQDTTKSARIQRRAHGCHRVVLPILIGNARRAPYQAVFGRACSLSDADALPELCERWLRQAV